MAIDPRIPMMGEATPFQSPFETQRNALALRQAQTEMAGAETKRALDMFRMGRQVLASAHDEGSYQRGREALRRAGIPVDDMPPNYDPEYVRSEGMALLDAEERYKQQLFQDGGDIFGVSPYTGQVNMLRQGPQAPPPAPKPVEPRLSEIVDPKNPMRSLRVDLNVYKGGTLGDPGVYGVSSIREPKAAPAGTTPKLSPADAAREREKGIQQAKIELAAPQAVADAQQAIDLLDRMVGNEKAGTGPHAGFQGAVGAGFGTRFIPGTNAADFQAMFNQIQGGAFLQAYESLRGGGAITEVEGAKATAARNRMSLAQSEKEFIAAAREYQSVLRAGVERMKAKLASGAPTATGSTPAADASGQRTTRSGTRYTIED